MVPGNVAIILGTDRLNVKDHPQKNAHAGEKARQHQKLDNSSAASGHTRRSLVARRNKPVRTPG